MKTLTEVVPAAIADMFRYEATSPTNSELVRQVKKVVRRLARPSKAKKPVTSKMLLTMVGKVEASEIGIRDMFMIILMFLGFLRESEVVALKFGDAWVGTMEGVEEEVLFIHVRKSKTDQNHVGAEIVVVACPGSPMCPVAWFRLHCRVRRSEEWVFHTMCPEARRLSAKTPSGILKRKVAGLGMDPGEFGSHSLRRGGTTAAARAGIRTHVLMRHGRWTSDAVYLYVVDDGDMRASVTRTVLRPTRSE